MCVQSPTLDQLCDHLLLLRFVSKLNEVYISCIVEVSHGQACQLQMPPWTFQHGIYIKSMVHVSSYCRSNLCLWLGECWYSYYVDCIQSMNLLMYWPTSPCLMWNDAPHFPRTNSRPLERSTFQEVYVSGVCTLCQWQWLTSTIAICLHEDTLDS